jgi:hypothetical protein
MMMSTKTKTKTRRTTMRTMMGDNRDRHNAGNREDSKEHEGG